jgi:hypothetical protein
MKKIWAVGAQAITPLPALVCCWVDPVFAVLAALLAWRLRVGVAHNPSTSCILYIIAGFAVTSPRSMRLICASEHPAICASARMDICRFFRLPRMDFHILAFHLVIL